MGNVFQCVIQPFLVAYGEPKRPDLEAFYDLYEDRLSAYSDQVLDSAVKRCIDTQVIPAWPTPGAVKKAADSCLGAPRPPEHFVDYNVEPPSVMARARVDRMVKQAIQKMEDGRPEYEGGVMPDVGRAAFEKMQRESPNFHLHMTPEGQRKFLETGRKPDHPKPNLMDTDTMRETIENAEATGLTELSKRMSGDRE